MQNSKNCSLPFGERNKNGNLDNYRFRERQLNKMQWQLLLFDGVAGKSKN